jgi:predicted DNA-binding transcriptional regulator AlpA
MSDREHQRKEQQRWMDIQRVCRETGLSRSGVYRIPELKPVRMGKRRALWLAEEVEAYIGNRIAERDRGGTRP